VTVCRIVMSVVFVETEVRVIGGIVTVVSFPEIEVVTVEAGRVVVFVMSMVWTEELGTKIKNAYNLEDLLLVFVVADGS
jgi:nitrate reductase NapAB chaperone NapD